MNARENIDKGLELLTSGPEVTLAMFTQQIEAKTQQINLLQNYDVKKPTELDTLIKKLNIEKKDFPAGRRALQKFVKEKCDLALVQLRKELSDIEGSRKLAATPGMIAILPFCCDLYLLGRDNNKEENFASLLKKHNLDYRDLINTIASQVTLGERIESYRIDHENERVCGILIADAQIEIINAMQLTGSNNEKLIKQFILENLKCAIKVKSLVWTVTNEIIRDFFLEQNHFLGYKDQDVFYPPLAKIFKLLSPIQPERLLTIFMMDIAEVDLETFKTSTDKSFVARQLKEALPEVNEEKLHLLLEQVKSIASQVTSYLEHASLMNKEIGRACDNLGMHADFSIWRVEIFSHIKVQIIASYVFPNPAFANLLISQEFGLIEKALKDPDFYIKPDYRSCIEAQTEQWTVDNILKRIEAVMPLGLFPDSPPAVATLPPEPKITPEYFYQACALGAYKKVKALLKDKSLKKSIFNRYKDAEGRNAFLIAVVNNHIKVAGHLLGHPLVVQDVVDGKGNSARLLATTSEMHNLFMQSVISTPVPTKNLPASQSNAVLMPAVSVTESKQSEIPETEKEKDFAEYLDFFSSRGNEDAIEGIVSIIVKHKSIEHDADRAEQLTALIEKADTLMKHQARYSQGAAAILKRKITPELKIANLSHLRSIFKEYKKILKGLQHCYQDLQLFDRPLNSEDIVELAGQNTLPVSSSPPAVLSPSWNATRSFFGANFIFSQPESAEEKEAKKQVHQDFEDIRSLSRLNVEDLTNDQKTKFFNSNNIIPSMHINALSFKLIQFMEKRKNLNNLNSEERKSARLMQNALMHSKNLYNETMLVASDDNNSFVTLYSDILFFVNRLIKSMLKKEPALLQESRFYGYLLGFGANLNKQFQTGEQELILDGERLRITQALEKQRLAYSFYVIAQDNPTVTLMRDCALQMLSIKHQMYGLLPLPLIAPKTLVLEQSMEEEKKFAPSPY